MDTVKDFPPIRVFGTIGFILTMWIVDFIDFEQNQNQFMLSGALSIVLFLYSFTLPACPVRKNVGKQSMVEVLGLQAFSLFRQKKMAIFFIFSMLLGVSLQITNGYATPFIDHFKEIAEYADSFGVKYPVVLYSVSQISETVCILFIPFFMKRYGIKQVMLIAMFAWTLRFAFLGLGNPGMPGILLFVLSMIVYGMAFDFFNISGSLYVDKTTNPEIRSSAQGLFMMMTNGFGASIGSLVAQFVVNSNTTDGSVEWTTVWATFSIYALLVGIAFALVFRPTPEENMV